MRFPHFFIDRPIFATVTVDPDRAARRRSPTSRCRSRNIRRSRRRRSKIRTSYPGASAEVVSDTVATPIEQEINGVEDMLYMISQATGDGQLAITVTFALGTDLDIAQVLVQNRVAVAEPRLPDEVRQIGVTVRKSSPDMLMVIHLSSSDGSRDPLYISNYATLQVRDVLARLDGVGDVRIFGSRDYSMRIWIDPEKAASRNLTAGEIVAALRSQNMQVASGVLDQPPVPEQGAFQLNVETLGRLSDPRQFRNIVIKTDADGRVTRLEDIARVELAAQDYTANGYLDERPAVPILVFQRPGSNALQTADRLIETMEELSKNFPPGLRYDIIYNPTEFIAKSVNEVTKTIWEAALLVVIVVVVFLQTWRAAIIPIVAIPISLIGTFIVMAALGYSLNNLSLFGLVLAIGIVVDDAIVVVENVERQISAGLSPREAAHRTMDEVGNALIAIALVLCAVFIPAALIGGIQGQFFRQFAVTIAAATVISAFVSLTLSPALCAILLKPHTNHAPGIAAVPPDHGLSSVASTASSIACRSATAALTRRFLRIAAVMLVVYAGLLVLTGWQFGRAPTGFIPEQDQGYLITVIQLPPGASLARTDAVVREATKLVLGTEGIVHAVPFAGFDGATFTNASNAGAIFWPLAPFEERDAERPDSGQRLQAK